MNKKHVLVSVLNWGLGHATRSIPVINTLMQNNFDVFIASDGDALTFLQKEFPALKSFNLPPYNVYYPANGSMAFSMLLQSPKIISAIGKENDSIKRIVAENNIDLVISDSRFGCYSEKVRSVFITHQLNIQAPAGTGLIVNKINRSFLEKFNEIWVPDFDGENSLSGNLSHGHSLKNVYYIGPLSRFNDQPIKENHNHKNKLMVLLSGPEPQRTILENALYETIGETDSPVLFVRGLVNEPISSILPEKRNIIVKNFLLGDELAHAIISSEIIICRSGYSSIMDLGALNKKAILIPTPGQTEQEYLAGYFHSKKIFQKTEQARLLNLKEAVDSMHAYSGIFSRNDFKKLAELIETAK